MCFLNEKLQIVFFHHQERRHTVGHSVRSQSQQVSLSLALSYSHVFECRGTSFSLSQPLVTVVTRARPSVKRCWTEAPSWKRAASLVSLFILFPLFTPFFPPLSRKSNSRQIPHRSSGLYYRLRLSSQYSQGLFLQISIFHPLCSEGASSDNRREMKV